MSTSSLAIVVSHSFPSTPPPSLSFPLHFNQRPPHHFRIFSLSTQPQPQPQGKSPTPTTKASARKPVATYLMDRLGFSEEDSLAISNKLLRLRAAAAGKYVQVTDLINIEKADNVITYLQEYCGLELSHIKKTVTKYPTLLAANVDKKIKPKIKLLEDSGFSTSDLPLVLSTNPFLYLACDLTPAIQALRGILGSDEDVVTALKGLKRDSGSTVAKNLIPNVTMLETEYGIPRDKIRKFLTKTPQTLVNKTEWLQDVLVRVEDKLGITRDSTEFLRALHLLTSRSDDNINSKCQVFRSCGWSDSDILSLIRRNPNCLTHSAAGIKNKLDFYINEVGYKPADMATRPVLFTFSLENRVVPRHRVLSILKEKGCIEADYQLHSAISLSDIKFFDRFIRPFQNVVPKLREVYIKDGAPIEELKHLETSVNERSTLVALE